VTVGKPSKNGLVENLILITDQLKSCDLDAYSARKNQKKTLLNATLLQILNLKQL